MDFFAEHDTFEDARSEQLISPASALFNSTSISETTIKTKSNELTSSSELSPTVGPTVKLSETLSSMKVDRKPTIGGRKVQSKRPGVSKKKKKNYLYTIILY